MGDGSGCWRGRFVAVAVAGLFLLLLMRDGCCEAGKGGESEVSCCFIESGGLVRVERAVCCSLRHHMYFLILRRGLKRRPAAVKDCSLDT